VVLTTHPKTVEATGPSSHPVDVVPVRGQVSPASGRVVLQRRTGKRWSDVARAAVGRSGEFVLTGLGLPVGTSTLRVVRAASGRTKAAASSSVTVTVTRLRPPPVTTQPQPTPGPTPAPSPAPTPIPTDDDAPAYSQATDPIPPIDTSLPSTVLQPGIGWRLDG
jgi:hypothetical protein